jgi:hypothetical protein
MRKTDPSLIVYLILDNYGSHGHPEVKQCFADHPRCELHLTPTSASWLNQVERWFAEITRTRIRRGTFRSVRELERAIRTYIRDHNKAPQPFQWVAAATPSSRRSGNINGLQRQDTSAGLAPGRRKVPGFIIQDEDDVRTEAA